MKKINLILVFILINCIFANAQIVDRCPTPNLSEKEIERVRNEIDSYLSINKYDGVSEAITIPIAFHVIRYESGAADVTNQQITDQIDVLNDAFSITNFRFSLHSINRINNTKWATVKYVSTPTETEKELKKELAINPSKILNFYTADTKVLGWARFPWDYDEDSYLHGTIIGYSTLPGGDRYPYNQGHTATHEIGHYFGLWHTFQGGCTGGDDVADTPAQANGSNKYDCNENLDTCPEDPGNDPVHNFMNYTDDYCIDNFTQDQSDRMDLQVSIYKPSLLIREKTIVVKQLLADGNTTVGTIGKWNGNSFGARFTPPKSFELRVGETEAFHGDSEMYSNQKYHDWNNENNVTNHHVFTITSDLSELTSNFRPAYSGVTIKNSFEGAGGGNIAFKDPWLIDYADADYGNNKRNRGMAAPFKERRSPFKPDYKTNYNGDVYQGIFLEQGYNQENDEWTPPYYSIAAQKHHATSDAIYEFSHWQATPANSATFQNENSRQTPVVFKQGNATVTAVYALI
jgi:hypothetical protein